MYVHWYRKCRTLPSSIHSGRVSRCWPGPGDGIVTTHNTRAWETWSIMVKRSICAGWGQTQDTIVLTVCHISTSTILQSTSTCPATFSRNYLSCQPAALGGMTRTLEDNFSSYLLLLILIILIWICAGDDQQFVKTPLNRNHWLEGPRCPAPPNQPLSCFIIGDTYEDSFISSYYIISLYEVGI